MDGGPAAGNRRRNVEPRFRKALLHAYVLSGPVEVKGIPKRFCLAKRFLGGLGYQGQQTTHFQETHVFGIQKTTWPTIHFGIPLTRASVARSGGRRQAGPGSACKAAPMESNGFFSFSGGDRKSPILGRFPAQPGPGGAGERPRSGPRSICTDFQPGKSILRPVREVF